MLPTASLISALSWACSKTSVPTSVSRRFRRTRDPAVALPLPTAVRTALRVRQGTSDFSRSSLCRSWCSFSVSARRPTPALNKGFRVEAGSKKGCPVTKRRAAVVAGARVDSQGQGLPAGAELVSGLHQGDGRIIVMPAGVAARAKESCARRHGRSAKPSLHRSIARRFATTAAGRHCRSRCTPTRRVGRSG
jgi:hypothetical protein